MRGAALALVLVAALSGAADAREKPPLYEAPAPGSYALPPIDRVRDWPVLDASGERVTLLGDGRVALVAFIYRSCSDGAGCPATLATLKSVDAELARRTTLASRVRMVTLSFDPEHDTPARMAELRDGLAPRSDWRFATTSSLAELAPILEDFGQDATRLVDATGEPLPAIRHVVKVFLVDPHGAVRNIYSAGMLSIPLVLADLETLVAETSSPRPSDRVAAP